MTEDISSQNIDPSEIRPLMQRQDKPGLIHVGIHGLTVLIAGGLLATMENIFTQFAFTVLLGLLLVFLFAPLHESIHKSAFRTPWINTVIGWICGFIILLPPKYFQGFHMTHHRHTQIEGKDPELDTKKPETLGQYIFLISGLMFWWEQFCTLFLFSKGTNQVNFISKEKHPGVVLEIRIFTFLYLSLILISLITGSAVLLKYWILPIIVGQPFLRAYLLAEHALCPRVTDMLQNTRTTLTNSAVRWLAWNMPYHVEHHAYPGVPFHQLSELHTLLRPHIKVLSDGYTSVNREVISSF